MSEGFILALGTLLIAMTGLITAIYTGKSSAKKNDLDALQKIIGALSLRLDAAEKENENLKRQVVDLQAENARLRLDLTALQLENLKLKEIKKNRGIAKT